MNIIKLCNLFYKFCTSRKPVPTVSFSIRHVYIDDIKKNQIDDIEIMMPKNWKERFVSILEIKNNILRAIPDKNDLTNMKKLVFINNLKDAISSTTKQLIMDTQELTGNNLDLYLIELKKLHIYEFTLGMKLVENISEWTFNVHAIISKMFFIINDYFSDTHVFSPTIEEIWKKDDDNAFFDLDLLGPNASQKTK